MPNQKSFAGATSTTNLETVVEKKHLKLGDTQKPGISNGFGGVFSPKQLTINLTQKANF
jgi:hypothetical protein